jgi:hypothetical protein
MNTNLINFRLTPDDLAALDAACTRLGASRAAVVRALIAKHAAKLKAVESSPNDPTRPGRRAKKKVKNNFGIVPGWT